jgi:hypothetical protein
MTETYREDLRDLAIAAGHVANYCDHADHNEAVDAAWVLGAAETLRVIAFRIADREGKDLLELYADRLGAIEARNVVSGSTGFDGAAAARGSSTWRDLQLVQLEHDRAYHPDVLGLHKSEQLRHYSFHLAKLVAALAREPSEQEEHVDFLLRRLPDMLLFGIKLTTVMGQKLPRTPIVPDYVASAPAVTFA